MACESFIKPGESLHHLRRHTYVPDTTCPRGWVWLSSPAQTFPVQGDVLLSSRGEVMDQRIMAGV